MSCPGNDLSGKRLVRETSVRESDCPGNVCKALGALAAAGEGKEGAFRVCPGRRRFAGAAFQTRHSKYSRGSTYWLKKVLKAGIQMLGCTVEMSKNRDKDDTEYEYHDLGYRYF